MAELRVEADLVQIKSRYDNGPIIIFADKIDENFLHIEAAILGPESTPYENAIILLDIKLSDQFPVRGKFFHKEGMKFIVLVYTTSINHHQTSDYASKYWWIR